jgi:hypothetical protein
MSHTFEFDFRATWPCSLGLDEKGQSVCTGGTDCMEDDVWFLFTELREPSSAWSWFLHEKPLIAICSSAESRRAFRHRESRELFRRVENRHGATKRDQILGQGGHILLERTGGAVHNMAGYGVADQPPQRGKNAYGLGRRDNRTCGLGGRLV